MTSTRSQGSGASQTHNRGRESRGRAHGAGRDRTRARAQIPVRMPMPLRHPRQVAPQHHARQVEPPPLQQTRADSSRNGAQGWTLTLPVRRSVGPPALILRLNLDPIHQAEVVLEPFCLAVLWNPLVSDVYEPLSRRTVVHHPKPSPSPESSRPELSGNHRCLGGNDSSCSVLSLTSVQRFFSSEARSLSHPTSCPAQGRVLAGRAHEEPRARL